MVFLCDKFGVDGYLDLMENKIASRFKQYLKDATIKLQLSLQPMTTIQEREMLMKIAECKNRMDVDDLLAIFYARRNMDPMCRYIRLAFVTAAELWSSRLLLKVDHNESWFRPHSLLSCFRQCIYSYSNITKEFEDVDNQRVDFILRNINDDNDYLSAEEKPNLKCAKRYYVKEMDWPILEV
ncbi:hypothetical protein A0J61_07982 [Choanephora cucurbitarum]|uniref:Uncharacterized protein n=1 Tax=Choanephora cucurbitarum TaxID=101091 RepID=A0A1C7N4E8_9FUNG|nr:hypothetical protein A0J61_07982 [Choanephora cucurbitarum]